MTHGTKHAPRRAAGPAVATLAAILLAGCSSGNIGESWQCPLAKGGSCDSVAAADPAVPDRQAAGKSVLREPLSREYKDREGVARTVTEIVVSGCRRRKSGSGGPRPRCPRQAQSNTGGSREASLRSSRSPWLECGTPPARSDCCGRVTIRGHSERLRAFVRFAEDRGWCTPGMAEGIVPGRFYPSRHVRSTLSRDEVRRLLATTAGDRPMHKRDRAILMLLIVYGLRAGEVRTLQLDDLDWENETLRVRRPKTGRTDLFPLSQAVGQAIVRYLVEVRPRRPERALFLTLSAPIQPLSRTAPGTMVRCHMDEAGIEAARRGTHALRHTAAQHLLDRGASMKVIGDYLGHRSLRSTKTYARFDLNALREVADFDLEGLA